MKLDQTAERIMADNFTALPLPLRRKYKVLLIKELKIRYTKERAGEKVKK